jgi:hypothetical protein
MEVKKTIEEALAKPMDRKQFLARTGAVTLSLIGATAALKAIGGKSSTNQSNGYGSSAYGGFKRR